jgi:hypothetical protein
MVYLMGVVVLAVLFLCCLPAFIGLAGLAAAVIAGCAVVCGLIYAVVYGLGGVFYCIGWLYALLPTGAQYYAHWAFAYASVAAVGLFCVAGVVCPFWRIYRLFKPSAKSTKAHKEAWLRECGLSPVAAAAEAEYL